MQSDHGMLDTQSPELIRDWQPPGVPADVDDLMRTAAWNAITTIPFLGIRDTNTDGIGETIQSGKTKPLAQPV